MLMLTYGAAGEGQVNILPYGEVKRCMYAHKMRGNFLLVCSSVGRPRKEKVLWIASRKNNKTGMDSLSTKGQAKRVEELDLNWVWGNELG